jgi:hypothetical protein
LGEGSLERAMNEFRDSMDRSSCHCSAKKNPLEESRNNTNALKSDNSLNMPTNRHRDHGCQQDTHSTLRNSRESSFKNNTPTRRRVPEEKLGVIKCLKCQKRLK